MCTGCGACYSLCKQHAISISIHAKLGIYVPQINYEKCTSCGICARICPGLKVNFKQINQEVFGHQPHLSLLGNFVKCYSGSANNYLIRDRVSSGGIATQLLIYALQKGIIDGALVAKMNEKNPLEAQPLLAKSSKEIISAAGSKYSPCPTDIKLGEILQQKGKYAIVGLPCHIHAIRKAQRIFPELSEKIPLTIGLICAHTASFKTVELLLSKKKIPKDNVVELTFRGNGWPGIMLIKTKDGKSHKITLSGSFKSYYPLFDSRFFVPWRCLFCQDHFNQLADISLGDAWLKEFKGSKLGQSIIVARTKNGQDLLLKSVSVGLLSLKPIEAQKVIQSQINPMVFKEKSWSVRLSLAQKMKTNVPSCSVTNQYYSSFGIYAMNLSYFYAVKLRKNKYSKGFVNALPLWFFRVDNIVLTVLAKFF